MPTSIFRFRCDAFLAFRSEGNIRAVALAESALPFAHPRQASAAFYFYYVVLFAHLHVRLIRRRSNRNRFPARTVTKRARVRMAIFLEPGAASGLA